MHLAKPEHEVAFQDLVALLRKHEAEICALEMLAIASNMIGKLLAMQDQRTLDVDKCMAIIMRNIELGNQQALEQLMKPQGNA